MNAHKSVEKAELSAFCEANGVRRLAIFGSALRDDFGQESDIDVLVEFQADRIPGLLGLAGMELELSKLFRGRRVDLRTLEDLSPYFRQEVLATAEVQYAQGSDSDSEHSLAGDHSDAKSAGSRLLQHQPGHRLADGAEGSAASYQDT